MNDVESDIKIVIHTIGGGGCTLRKLTGVDPIAISIWREKAVSYSHLLSQLDARTLALMLIRLTQSSFPDAAPDDLDALRAEYLNFRQDVLDAMNERDETGRRSLKILLRHFQLEQNFDGEGHDRLIDPRALALKTF